MAYVTSRLYTFVIFVSILKSLFLLGNDNTEAVRLEVNVVTHSKGGQCQPGPPSGHAPVTNYSLQAKIISVFIRKTCRYIVLTVGAVQE